MAINKKLIHFKNKQKFEEELANNNILDTSICFIQDSKEIWTHGNLFNCSDKHVTDGNINEVLSECISGKQDKLVSGTNIKTINGESILGEGDLIIEGGFSDANVQAVDTTETIDDVETNIYVKYVAQTLTEEQKAQVRENIGVGENVSQEYVDSAIANAITNTLNTAV